MAITFNSVPTTAAASAVFVEQEAVNRGNAVPVLPRKILVIGQVNTGKTPTFDAPRLILNNEDAWDLYGRGSLLANMIAKANPIGSVQVYALPVADAGGAVAATGTIAITGTATAAGTLAVYVAGVRIPVTVADGDTATEVGDAIVAAVNAKLDLPVTAANLTGTVTFTVRWAGAAGNQILLETNRRDADETPAGLTVTVTDIGDVVAGATNPTLTTALAALGDTWYTDIACPYLDDTSLDALESAGDTRYGYGVKRMFAGFVGYTDTTANLLTALGDRNSQWTTYVPVHGSPTPAYEIAAVVAGIFSRKQQATPGRPLKHEQLTGVIAGDDNDITYSTRDTIVKAGGSHTYNQDDDTVTVGDLVTTKLTESSGAETTDWRFTIIIPNLQYKVYSIEQTFLLSPFDQGVVVADGGPAGPTYAIRPSTVKAYAVKLVDDWIDKALSTDRESIIDGTSAVINSDNAGRIDLVIGDVASAGLRIVAIKLEWAFITG